MLVMLKFCTVHAVSQWGASLSSPLAREIVANRFILYIIVIMVGSALTRDAGKHRHRWDRMPPRGPVTWCKTYTGVCTAFVCALITLRIIVGRPRSPSGFGIFSLPTLMYVEIILLQTLVEVSYAVPRALTRLAEECIALLRERMRDTLRERNRNPSEGESEDAQMRHALMNLCLHEVCPPCLAPSPPF